MHQLYRNYIEEAKKEIEKCDPYIIILLAKAGSAVGKALMSKKITWQEENEKMEEISHLESEFRSNCSCISKTSIAKALKIPSR
jgi:hypothetical protein